MKSKKVQKNKPDQAETPPAKKSTMVLLDVKKLSGIALDKAIDKIIDKLFGQ